MPSLSRNATPRMSGHRSADWLSPATTRSCSHISHIVAEKGVPHALNPKHLENGNGHFPTIIKHRKTIRWKTFCPKSRIRPYLRLGAQPAWPKRFQPQPQSSTHNRPSHRPPRIPSHTPPHTLSHKPPAKAKKTTAVSEKPRISIPILIQAITRRQIRAPTASLRQPHPKRPDTDHQAIKLTRLRENPFEQHSSQSP